NAPERRGGKTAEERQRQSRQRQSSEFTSRIHRTSLIERNGAIEILGLPAGDITPPIVVFVKSIPMACKMTFLNYRQTDALDFRNPVIGKSGHIIRHAHRSAISDPGVDMFAAALLVFFVSGFAALVYHVIWQRLLTIFSGADVQSATLVVAAFMTGLGCGSLVGGHIADRVSR